jgi:hypothetical protein
MKRHSTRTGLIRALVTLLAVTVTAGCGELIPSSSGPRAPGPFDPGQNGLPDVVLVEESCGGRVVNGLESLTESYFALALEWERYLVYVEGVKTDGVTVEEHDGGAQRYRRIQTLLNDYRESAERVRYDGGLVAGPTAARCDNEVMVVFEKAYQARQPEIDYVAAEGKRQAEILRKRAGVSAE